MTDSIGFKTRLAMLRSISAQDKAAFFPMRGGGGSSLNIAEITPGTITRVRLGSAPSCRAGQMIKLNSVGGMTQIEGYQLVLDVSGNYVWLAVDSSSYSAWTSGGTMSFTHLHDEFGRAPSLDVQGTTTNIWATPGKLTADSGGTNSNIGTDTNGVFDLRGFNGLALIGLRLEIAAAPSAQNTYFAAGVRSASGANSAPGAIALTTDSATSTVGLVFRPATSADTAAATVGSNTFSFTGSLTVDTPTNIAFLMDLRDGVTNDITAFNGGALVDSDPITMTGKTDWPWMPHGFLIGAQYGSALTTVTTTQMGDGTSGAKLHNLLWWATERKTRAQMIDAALAYTYSGRLPVRQMV